MAECGCGSAQALARMEAEQARQGELLAVILQRLDAGRGPRDAADLTLLRQIATSIGAVPFTAAALFKRLELEDDPALRAALLAADIDSPRQLGKLLRRCGRGMADVDVTCLESHRAGLLWQVRVSRE